MAHPIERFVADVEYLHQSQKIRIEIPYGDYETLLRRGYHKAEVILMDDRPLSDRQRRACFAMLKEISDYMGEEPAEVKEFMKMEFMTSEMCETGDRLFSMSTAPMSLIASFQRFLARFIIRHDIPTKKPMLKYVDDIGDYVYSCLVHKRCAVCGKPSDLHHFTSVGMGNDREEIIHEGMLALPLCREHHTICHTMGSKRFADMMHLEPVRIDKELCKIYGLKRKEDTK